MIPELQEGVDFDAEREYYEKERKWIRAEKPLEVTVWNPSTYFWSWYNS